MTRKIVESLPDWITVIVVVAGVLWGGGILQARIAYCEKQIGNLSNVPERTARMEEQLKIQHDQLEKIDWKLDRALSKKHTDNGQ